MVRFVFFFVLLASLVGCRSQSSVLGSAGFQWVGSGQAAGVAWGQVIAQRHGVDSLALVLQQVPSWVAQSPSCVPVAHSIQWQGAVVSGPVVAQRLPGGQLAFVIVGSRAWLGQVAQWSGFACQR